jgi:uncharacterized protein YecE (DUF72 family)
MSSFYATVKEGLKEKCGCYLFQLPPNYHYDDKKLQRILDSLDLTLPNVLEFRHESWWNEEVFAELAARKVSFCGMSHPELPQAVIKNTPLLYYRFHGKEQLYASKYAKEDLESFANSVNQEAHVNDVFVFFNNDINTNAVYNAKELQAFITSLEKC